MKAEHLVEGMIQDQHVQLLGQYAVHFRHDVELLHGLLLTSEVELPQVDDIDYRGFVLGAKPDYRLDKVSKAQLLALLILRGIRIFRWREHAGSAAHR